MRTIQVFFFGFVHTAILWCNSPLSYCKPFLLTTLHSATDTISDDRRTMLRPWRPLCSIPAPTAVHFLTYAPRRCLATSGILHAAPRPEHSDAELDAARAWLSRLTPANIPRSTGELSFSRSSGPGGQNVNKFVPPPLPSAAMLVVFLTPTGRPA